MPYFGEYLISKGMLSQEALVSLLVEQVSQLPSMLQIVHDKKLLPAETLLKILVHQADHEVDFQTACQALGFWTQGFKEQIQKEIASVRMPLGRMLVKKKILTLDEMIQVLDEFLSQSEVREKIQQQVVQFHVSEDSTSSLSRQPVFMDSFSVADPLLLEEFFSFLTLEKIETMRVTFQKFEKANELEEKTLLAALQTLMVHLHSIRGLLRCLHMSQFEGLSASLESVIVEGMKALKEKKKEFLKTFFEIGFPYFELLTDFRAHLQKGEGEKTWFESSERQKKVEALFVQLMGLLK